MATVTLQGNTINTNGGLPAVGEKAPDFTLVDKDLGDVHLSNFVGKKKILSIVPSLDTPICGISTKKFNDYAAENEGVAVLVISADLPFAMSRFCTAESAESVQSLSMMRGKQFAEDYGVLLQDGPLAGITARAVVVLNQEDEVVYTELVPEIAEEPDYEQAIAALGS